MSHNNVGSDWLIEEVENFIDHIDHVKPSDFNEQFRYLPESVTSIPGYIRYAVNPYMREIIDCADVNNPVRECNVMKGVQITYTTLLESILLYFMAHIKTVPCMYITADKELADARIENSIIPMINQSDFGDIIRSSDEGNTRKTGKTKNHIQWAGGGYLVPFGANNAAKMRMFSIMVMLKDEVDAWPLTVGKDGDPDDLSDARTDGYTDRSKIFRGSTPLLKPTSVIYRNYLKGDQRKYLVLCRSCGFPQELRWQVIDKETGVVSGFEWDYDTHGTLLTESVRYTCQNCQHAHYEHDKQRLYNPEHGAHWNPTATPVERNIRSYHLPALYSPVGMRPWWKNVIQYLDAWDVKENKVKNIPKYQVFYNNVLAMPFEPMGSRILFSAVSAHRRSVYRLGEIPNKYIIEYSGSPILFLIMQVDVHDSNLAVSVFGVARHSIMYLIDYWRFEQGKTETKCSDSTHHCWQKVRELIDEKEYIADDGKKYRIVVTGIDASYATTTVTGFCSEWDTNVFPLLGRDRPSKSQSIVEFAEWTTKLGTVGYRLTVDYYKDRMAPVLRREWHEDLGLQNRYHFNAPVDTTDKQLNELTAEIKREKLDETTGIKSWYWYRPSGRPNELFDMLGYGYATVEIIAWKICIEHFELSNIDWNTFWDYIENDQCFYIE